MDKKDHSKAVENIFRLLQNQLTAVLGTRGDEYPYASLVGFVFSDISASNLYFATFRDSNKYKNIMKDPKVSLLVDSRQNEESDFADAQALAAFGQCTELPSTDVEYVEVKRLYISKFGELSGFISDPATALMRLDVDRYQVVSRFQEVVEIRMKK